MAKQSKSCTCHNCLEDFNCNNLFRVLISKKSPHYIMLCGKCEKTETRKVPGTESVPYKPFKSTYRIEKKPEQNE